MKNSCPFLVIHVASQTNNYSVQLFMNEKLR